ncbi:MAG: hypothetical protein J6V44_05520 [Methanobrevibacter sp.]|nr:hypothetical protein [Methanobrevibacter sp.]MBO7696035.1 hypothetical protein [Methanobrevibacter sp.]
MGPIQTALNKLVGAVSGAVVGGAKLKEHEGQIAAQEEQARVKKNEAAAEERKEARAVATEADLQNLGASEVEAKAFRLAQERGLADPKRIIYDEAGKPIATYEEMANLLADQSLTGTLSSRLRGKNAVKFRKQLLEGKTHKERVDNALLSVGGGRK